MSADTETDDQVGTQVLEALLRPRETASSIGEEGVPSVATGDLSCKRGFSQPSLGFVTEIPTIVLGDERRERSKCG